MASQLQAVPGSRCATRQLHHRVSGGVPRRGRPLASRQATWIVDGGPEPPAAPGANCWRRSSAHAPR
ncbi:hypothetical protein ACS0Y6_36470, partial [Burkholderia gladioli]|uniref:hypothetical protein n=1 Tax=Burkholderia gladioli TaxID=28095 RepID=UPI003F7AAAB3